jgi:hypothetical protein
VLDDPLLSWRDGPVKSRVMDAVTALAAELPPARRIAAFDQDGTLCCERPLDARAYFLIAHWREMVAADPGRAAEQPYKAAAVGDYDYFADLADRAEEVRGWVGSAFAGLRVEEYTRQVEHFMATARHPRFPDPFTRLTYEPLQELLDLLRDNGFTVFIRAADRDFTRAVSHETYGVPAHQVLGPAALVEYRNGTLRRRAEFEPALGVPAEPAKLVDVVRACGYPPVFAAGNGDDDLELLRLARFPLVLRHDDTEREYAYDDGAQELLATANAADWTVVSMRDDLTRVFVP